MQYLDYLTSWFRGNRTFFTSAFAIGYVIYCQFKGVVPDPSILATLGAFGAIFIRLSVPGTTPPNPQPVVKGNGFVGLALAAVCLLPFFTGCALQRPFITERTETTNGVVQLRTMKQTAVAIWPATSELAKGRLSAGKTLSIGVEGQQLESGSSTNDVEALRNIRGILGR